ncbi:helix-turn-helix transcriptional regulator [uncultured Tenacibaculum sp.]|uniref:helix-turn-helix domain-containing protein n=1 Tax=uncultured Tenacibaculum sp. TaxID=174713 RepID=UPI0026248D36|nr:helix-turn-helix transcriptional regulator [uncultured Tenacibaculum sp.]
MFKEILRKYITLKGLTQNDIANIIGDSPQAVSDFLSKQGNPRSKTKEKYFKIEGFEEFFKKEESNLIYSQNNLQLDNDKLNALKKTLPLNVFTPEEILDHIISNNKDFKNESKIDAVIGLFGNFKVQQIIAEAYEEAKEVRQKIDELKRENGL